MAGPMVSSPPQPSPGDYTRERPGLQPMDQQAQAVSPYRGRVRHDEAFRDEYGFRYDERGNRIDAAGRRILAAHDDALRADTIMSLRLQLGRPASAGLFFARVRTYSLHEPGGEPMKIVRRREALILGGAAALAASGKAFAQEPPKPAQIVVNHSGGSMGSAMRKAFFNGFEKKYGIRVVETSPADFGKLRAMVESGNVEWDVTEIGGQDAIRATQMKLVEKIDDKIVDRSKYPDEGAARPTSSPRRSTRRSSATAPTSSKAARQPKSWADWWDVKKFPGARSMRNHPTDNLEFALIADGVPKDKVYPIDFDRAFKKLDQIKPHVTRVVVDRPAAGAAAARQGSRAGDRLERPLLRPDQEGRADRDRMERGRAEAGQLRHPARRQEPVLGPEDAGRDVGAAAAGGLCQRARLSRPEPRSR